MSYKLVLWDFDGTLANTLHLALEIYNRLAAERGYQQVHDPHAVRDMGMRKFLSAHGVPVHRVPFLFTEFLKDLKTKSKTIDLNTGIAECVRAIRSAGIRQAVVSSNDTETIRQCLNSNDVADCFDDVCGTSRIFGKERGLKAAIAKFAVTAEQTLYVGDEIRDLEAAGSVNVDMAAVGWGLNSRRALLKHSPRWFAAEPSELLSIIRRQAAEVSEERA